jgi:hypothetical protein
LSYTPSSSFYRHRSVFAHHLASVLHPNLLAQSCTLHHLGLLLGSVLCYGHCLCVPLFPSTTGVFRLVSFSVAPRVCPSRFDPVLIHGDFDSPLLGLKSISQVLVALSFPVNSIGCWFLPWIHFAIGVDCCSLLLFLSRSHAHEVFDKMCVRQWESLLVCFGCRSPAHGFACINLCFCCDSVFLTRFRGPIALQ